MVVRLKVKLVPWDDRAFLDAVDVAAANIESRGLRLDDADGALALQRELRAIGFPNATCYCERTVEEALAHQTRCVVTRDGTATVVLGTAISR
jgi:hypothetical protein